MPIYQDQVVFNNSKESNKKKQVKFAILVDRLFICLFQFSYQSFSGYLRL